jgi:exodeoxyribonuclease VII large subunit
VKRLGTRTVWSVAEVTLAIWRRFEGVPGIWVEAEVANLGRRGGQVYFTLSDDHAIEASMNAIVFDRLPVRPADGALVHAYGRVEFWRPRSVVRMRVERLEPAGEGLLLAQIEALKGRLATEGLMDAARKRPLPALPRRIGLVTSGEGAARDDVLRNLWARFPADVLLVATPVQGEGAPEAIVRALRYLDRTPDVDVVVLARGGGPLEDLMAFNSEPVCRAVAASRTPVVSAVGHEKDVTVCDLVADVRVSTPTAAAAALVPDAAALSGRLDAAERALGRCLRRASARAGERLAGGAAAIRRGLVARGDAALAAVAALGARLSRATDVRAERAASHLERADALLTLLAPSRTVARGYAIVRDGEGGVVTSAAGLRAGQPLDLELRDGRVPARVGNGGPG